MEQKKISVVIPVYKVELYLRRCVDSVLRQNIKDLEVILVDDGSPDSCPSICDEYANCYDYIKVIHKKNGGLSSARNAGMSIAKGKYLFFLDSDDWVEDDGLETLFECAEKYNVDFVRYRPIRSNWPNMEEHAPCRVEDVREMHGGYYDLQSIREEVYPRLLSTTHITLGAIVGACSSLYRMEFIREHNLRFCEEIQFSEDVLFSAQVVRAAKCFFYIDAPGIYHYFYNPLSISKSFRSGRWTAGKKLVLACESAFLDDKAYDFSLQLEHLRWFSILLALNERHYLANTQERICYCRNILQDSFVKETPLKLHELNVSWKQMFFMCLVKAGLYQLIAKV